MASRVYSSVPMPGGYDEPVSTMKRAESTWWRLPVQGGYLLAAAGPILAFLLHHGLAEGLEDRSVFLLATVPVAIASILGGLGPGLTATLVGLVGAALFFLSPVGSLAIRDPLDRVALAGYGLLWTLITVLGDYMRRAVRRNADDRAEAVEHQSRLETILAGITDGFYAVNLDWRITHVNAAFEAIVGRPRRELIGAYLWDVYREPAHYETRVKMTECLRRNEPYIKDLPDEKTGRWFHVRAYPNREGMFVYVQDVTDERELVQSRERMLIAERKARAEAESTNRMKDEFVATLSHELRSPLTTILGWTEILRQKPDLEPKVEEGLAAIDRSAHHQSQLIGDLLDLSRIAAGKLQLEPEMVNLADTALEAVELARPAADRKGVRLEVSIREDPALVRGDPQRLYQILNNLLSNAIKFTPSGGWARVQVEGSEGFVICSVEDNGEGIDPDFRPFLFDRFRQSDASASRKHGGLGLGLAIVRQLVELHGGQIWAESEGVGKGSRFALRLPAVDVPVAFSSDVSPPELEPISLAGMRVLVVDDEGETRRILKTMLADAGAEVGLAESGPSALDQLSARHYDVLLSDIGMPEMDGYQFLKLAKRRFRGNGGLPPAIALTAFVNEDDRAKSRRAGFIRHLGKPIDRRELVRAVHAAGHPLDRAEEESEG